MQCYGIKREHWYIALGTNLKSLNLSMMLVDFINGINVLKIELGCKIFKYREMFQ